MITNSNNRSKRAFVAVAESYAIVSRFLPGITDRDFFLSYAEEFPNLDDYTDSCFWMSGGYAARMQRAGIAPNLVAPGQAWLSTISESLTGRRITTALISELQTLVDDESLSLTSEIFFKPAEAKIDSLKAGVYSVENILEIFKNENIPTETLFQWTESILQINHEHRFFVANREVKTGSPYLINGGVYTSEMESENFSEAWAAAENFLKLLRDNQPPAFTLDVGLREDTNEWIIIEANPAWSSGPYGCDPSKILETLDVACNYGSDENFKKWLWKPAEYLVQRALEAPFMKTVSIAEATGVFQFERNT